jgi:hypothetical protein
MARFRMLSTAELPGDCLQSKYKRKKERYFKERICAALDPHTMAAAVKYTEHVEDCQGDPKPPANSLHAKADIAVTTPMMQLTKVTQCNVRMQSFCRIGFEQGDHWIYKSMDL